mgnify:CR=1 FL=1
MPLGYVGLALSTALAAYVNVSMLLFLLIKRNIYIVSKESILFIVKALIAGIVMCSALRYISPSFDEWITMGTLESIAYLIAMIMLGGLIYGGTVLLLGIKPRSLKR